MKDIFKEKCHPLERRQHENLKNMGTQDLLHCIDLVKEYGESLDDMPEHRSQIIEGEEGDAWFELCERYKGSIKEYCYRQYYKDDD